MKLQKPKGTQDILPGDSAKWQYVENVARETFKKYNYGEIRKIGRASCRERV